MKVDLVNSKLLPKKSTMKKIIYLFILLPIIGFCQDNFTDYNKIISEIKILKGDDNKKKNKVHRLEIGLNGGFNFANLRDFDPAQGIDIGSITNDKLGALYGGTIVYNFNRFLCVKGDFDIASKGFEMSNVEFEGAEGALQAAKTGNVKQLLSYFDVPAFFHIGFGKKLKFDINFGPYLSFLLENRSKLVDMDGKEVSLTDNALAFSFENMDKIDWGWVGGAGIDYHLTEKISLGFDFLIEQGQKVLNGGANFGEFKNFSRDFDFGINFLLVEKKSKKLF